MAEMNIALNLFGIAVTLLLLLCGAIESRERDRQTYVLMAMMAANAGVMLCDLLTWKLEDLPHFDALNYALNFFVYSLGYVMAILFTRYLALHISKRGSVSRWIINTINTLCAVGIFLVAVSLFNGMYFSFEQGVYSRGPLFWFSQSYPAVILLLDMGIILFHRRSLGRHDTLALLSYEVLPITAMLISIVAYGLPWLSMATTLSLLIIYIMIHVEQGRRLKEREAELVQERVNIMLSQIQPHFLYNALNTIKYLCDTNESSAGETVSNFADYLRGNMDSLTQKEPIPFEKDLEHLNNYLAIEKLRFANLRVELDIGATGFTLPPLTLQPIVENAIRYGVCCREEGGTVRVATREDGRAVHITIADDGVGFDPEAVQYDGRSHIGIENTRSRLAAMCGGTLTVKSAPGEGTEVHIVIPKGDEPCE